MIIIAPCRINNKTISLFVSHIIIDIPTDAPSTAKKTDWNQSVFSLSFVVICFEFLKLL